MDNGIDYFPVFSPHQCQLSGAVFNAINSFPVRNRGKKPAEQCGLSGAGSPCHTHRDPISDTFRKKIQHGIGCGSAIYKIFFLHTLRIHDSNGCGHAHIFINNGGFQHSDTDIFGEMPQNTGTGIIQHHAGDMKHTAHYVDCVFRAVKMFFQLFCDTA